MKKKLSILIVCLFSVLFLSGCSLPGQKPKQGALSVYSTPRATVFLDGKHVGQTEFYDEKIKPGEYIIKLDPELEATESSSWSTKIKINPEILTVIFREFSETKGQSSGEIFTSEFMSKNKDPELMIIVKPSGAGIKIDGETKGSSPLIVSNLKAGDFKVNISAQGYKTRDFNVKLNKGYRTTVTVDLAKIDSQKPTPTPVKKISPTTTEKKVTPTVIPTDAPEITDDETASQAAEKKIEIGSEITINETETGWLRVRVEPKIDSTDGIAKVNPGQNFIVLDQQAEWIKIEYESGKEGWVNSNYVTAE